MRWCVCPYFPQNNVQQNNHQIWFVICRIIKAGGGWVTPLYGLHQPFSRVNLSYPPQERTLGTRLGQYGDVPLDKVWFLKYDVTLRWQQNFWITTIWNLSFNNSHSNGNGKNATGLYQQNNNFTHASSFFVHSLAVVARFLISHACFMEQVNATQKFPFPYSEL